MAISDWFSGVKSAPPADPRPPLTAPVGGYSLLAPFWPEAESAAPFAQSYPAQIRAAYERNAIAQRAVRIVADGVGGAPVTANDARLLALVRATSAGQSLLETVAAHLTLHGNAYVRVLSGADGAPVELIALRPERVRVQAGADGWPIAYIYGEGETAEIYPVAAPDALPDIIHIKAFHPSDDLIGMGCLGAAGEAIAVHNAAARWNRALLDNGARPSGALVYDPGDGGNLTPQQFDRLKDELEANFSGARNSGRPLLLEGGLKWQALSLSPADMDFASLKEAAAREIALAFGVPPMLLGLPGDNSYANYREANRALWRLTLLPLCTKILGALAEGLRPAFEAAKLSVDLDKLPALSEDRERYWEQISGAEFLTRAEKRRLLGFDEEAQI